MSILSRRPVRIADQMTSLTIQNLVSLFLLGNVFAHPELVNDFETPARLNLVLLLFTRLPPGADRTAQGGDPGRDDEGL